jgi:hypothetical protein
MNGRVPRATNDSKDRVVVSRPSDADQFVDLASESRDQELDPAKDGEDQALVRTWLREAIDESDEQWKDTAVAEHIGLKGESGANYFSKMLRGEKPISVRHLRSLPADIQRRYATKHAEHLGLIVVAPLHGDDAVRSFVAGVVGLLAPMLSMKPRMARASLPVAKAERRRA